MKPTQTLWFGRLRLTTKDVNKGFYKGNRTGAMGRHTKHGGYKIEWERVRSFVVPKGLANFQLTPFVTRKIEFDRSRFPGIAQGARSPIAYLDKWKEENGLD